MNDNITLAPSVTAPCNGDVDSLPSSPQRTYVKPRLVRLYGNDGDGKGTTTPTEMKVGSSTIATANGGSSQIPAYIGPS